MGPGSRGGPSRGEGILMQIAPAFIGGLGTQELFLIFVVVLLLFGPKRLPEIARSLGKVFEQFRDASQDFKDQVMKLDEEPLPPPPTLDVEATESTDIPDVYETAATESTVPEAASPETPVSEPTPPDAGGSPMEDEQKTAEGPHDPAG